MLKKLLCLSTLLCASTFANTNQSLSSTVDHSLPALGYSREYTLPPQEPQEVTNPFYFVVKASCKITSASEINYILVRFLKKTGEVNSQPLQAGDRVEIVLDNKKDIMIVANPGSKVELTNQGDMTITAVCTGI